MCKYYAHIVPGTVQSSATGPVIYREGITIPLATNVQEFKLEEKSNIENHIIAGLWVTNPGTKLRLGKTVAATAIFDTAYLTLRVNSEVVMDELYLHQILAANLRGDPFPVSLSGPITMSRSTLTVQDPANIVADTAIQIQVDYLKK